MLTEAARKAKAISQAKQVKLTPGFARVPRPRKSEAEIEREIAEHYAAEHRQKVELLLGVCGVPIDYLDAVDRTADSLPPDARAGWNQVRELILSNAAKQFIAGLVGQRGTGKTTAACAAVLQQCHLLNYAKYVVAYSYIREANDARYNSRISEAEVEDKYVRPKLLVIDEVHMIAATDRDDVALKSLLQRRWDARRATVLIANETAKAFLDRVGKSIADRMRQGGTILACEWKSLRARPAGAQL